MLVVVGRRDAGGVESNRVNINGAYVDSLVQLLHVSSECMSERMPSRQATEAFLRLQSVETEKTEVYFDEVVSRCLFDIPLPVPSGCEGRVVAIDELVIECEKWCSEAIYKGVSCLVLTLSIDAAAGTVLAYRVNRGNSVSGTGRTDVLEAALRRLAAGGFRWRAQTGVLQQRHD